ncbi:MAG TPA: Gfo/Idh/MocA family oxidoreductase, partial [Chthoniobacterales bacterium]|nr:Gfo/Idh/MocA family oxidoreductase [Chthoniobacterales bacterium]
MRKWPLNPPFGVGFLGLGRMGETHLRNLLGLPGVKVVVVADPRLEAAEHGKALAGAEEATTDVERAINSPSVDAVVIVTPTNTHARLLESPPKPEKPHSPKSRDTYPPSLEFRKFPRPFRSGLSPGAGSLFPRVARGTQTSTRPGRR